GNALRLLFNESLLASALDSSLTGPGLAGLRMNVGNGNLGEADNFNVSASFADVNGDGVPDKPPAALLRARATAEYDDQGRAFRTHVYSVDQSTGAVSSGSLTADTFYDHRGEAIKEAQPGGLVQKAKFDGAGRTT